MKNIPPKQITKPQTFILESLSLEDERKNRLDGKLLFEALKIYRKRPKYYYFRTERELRCLAEEFRNSGYRYLHISCHGAENLFQFTFNQMNFLVFADIFKEKLDNRRLFISGCDLGNRQLADAVFAQNGGMYSVIAPRKPIFFNQSVAFWTAFHYRMGTYTNDSMKKDDITQELNELSKLFEVKMSYFWKNTQTNSVSFADFPIK
ncbi:MAG: hypothetical protein ABSA51_10610 [Anaerolineaceae bacterium]|jgi:hypothetical protein